MSLRAFARPGQNHLIVQTRIANRVQCDGDGERPLPATGLLVDWSEPLAAAIPGKFYRVLYPRRYLAAEFRRHNRLEHWGGRGFIDGGGGTSRKVEVSSRSITNQLG